jgi:hypothetical protein
LPQTLFLFSKFAPEPTIFIIYQNLPQKTNPFTGKCSEQVNCPYL